MMSRSRRKLILTEGFLRYFLEIPDTMELDFAQVSLDPLEIFVNISVDSKDAPWNVKDDIPGTEAEIILIKDWFWKYSRKNERVDRQES